MQLSECRSTTFWLHRWTGTLPELVPWDIWHNVRLELLFSLNKCEMLKIFIDSCHGLPLYGVTVGSEATPQHKDFKKIFRKQQFLSI